MKIFIAALILTHAAHGAEHWSKEKFLKDKVKKAMEALVQQDLKDDISAINSYKSGFGYTRIVHFLELSERQTLSQRCAQDLNLTITSLIDTFIHKGTKYQDFVENAALPMLDAFGKLPPGIGLGAVSFWGYQPECSRISYKKKDGSLFEGSYSRVYFDINGTITACDPNNVELIGIDMCTPKTCANDDDLEEIGKSLKFFDENIDVCYADILDEQPAKRTYKTWIVLGIIIAMKGMSVIVTLADYLFYEILGFKKYNRHYLIKIATSFSLHRNILEIFTVSSNTSGQITTIHCIRFFSTCWVVLGHTTVFSALIYNNVLEFATIIKNLPTQIIANAQFSVDSFFLISGVLVSFLWFKQYKKDKSQTMSKKSWVLFYVHRYLRLSPPYYMAVAFYAFVYFTMISDKPALIDITAHKSCVKINNNNSSCADPCSKTWWTNFLYLNNFIDYNSQCYGVSWYLATDFQMYAFSPLILIPLALKPWLGWLTAILIFVASTAANIATVYANRYPPVEYNGIGWLDPKETNPGQYDMLIYQAPWIRCQVYIIGILAGWVMQTRPKMKINKILNIALWLISIALMVTVVLSLKNWMNNQEMSLFWRAMYSAFSKPAWGLGLAWIMVSCYYGYGGPINAFMSLKIWVPLSRVSYCVYLLHVMVLVYIIGMTKSPLIFSGFPHLLVTLVIPVIFVSFVISTFYSALFEVPFSKIETYLLKGYQKAEKSYINNNNDVWGVSERFKKESC